jgi:hypothetical protein
MWPLPIRVETSLTGGGPEVLGSLLQNVGREPRFHSFTLVAFNIHTQKIIHRQENVSVLMRVLSGLPA